MSTWHKGPPPSVGWWPASANRDKNFLRWWNGSWWSQAARNTWDAREAEIFACNRACQLIEIEWRHRPVSWPERSKT